jgi:hypothetical protein
MADLPLRCVDASGHTIAEYVDVVAALLARFFHEHGH